MWIFNPPCTIFPSIVISLPAQYWAYNVIPHWPWKRIASKRLLQYDKWLIQHRNEANDIEWPLECIRSFQKAVGKQFPTGCWNMWVSFKRPLEHGEFANGHWNAWLTTFHQWLFGNAVRPPNSHLDGSNVFHLVSFSHYYLCSLHWVNHKPKTSLPLHWLSYSWNTI